MNPWNELDSGNNHGFSALSGHSWTWRELMSFVTKSIFALGILSVTIPSALIAGDREDARLAITEARAKIETGDKAGVNGPAADAQARARAALDEAQDEFHKHHEDRAMAAAQRASSLADLALATAQARAADAQRRDAIANPQE
jgi:hypothetical protein